MFSKRQWEMAAATPVATLAKFTVVDTAAGDNPVPRRIVDEVGPRPIPSEPSTSDATNPARATSSRSDISTNSIGKTLPAQSGRCPNTVALPSRLMATLVLLRHGQSEWN